ncbi:uncharacterized protein LOC126273335 [Schistocerca gregaria]|uniref:uncharacterized protein LOC126273335 n=1 Tax=Schistocerca gregaria TaxID=7010 RepID=UPI00211EBC8E|nr:uncharacterized protein LOC126273335 [Schistocerca gregaria]
MAARALAPAVYRDPAAPKSVIRQGAPDTICSARQRRITRGPPAPPRHALPADTCDAPSPLLPTGSQEARRCHEWLCPVAAAAATVSSAGDPPAVTLSRCPASVGSRRKTRVAPQTPSPAALPYSESALLHEVCVFGSEDRCQRWVALRGGPAGYLCAHRRASRREIASADGIWRAASRYGRGPSATELEPPAAGDAAPPPYTNSLELEPAASGWCKGPEASVTGSELRTQPPSGCRRQVTPPHSAGRARIRVWLARLQARRPPPSAAAAAAAAPCVRVRRVRRLPRAALALPAAADPVSNPDHRETAEDGLAAATASAAAPAARPGLQR